VVGQALLKEVYEQINAKGEGPVQQAQ